MDSSKRRRGAQSYSSRQSGEKQHNKGLRHFSQRVCEKVREKGATTYNEVWTVHVHEYWLLPNCGDATPVLCGNLCRLQMN